MSDELNKKIQQIAEMLGQENMPDNVKGLLSLLAGSGSKEESSPKAAETDNAREEKPPRSDMDDNIEMMKKFKRVMDRLNTNDDPRIHLLHSLSPFLSIRRQKKLNNCIKMLQMTGLARLMDEQDKK